MRLHRVGREGLASSRADKSDDIPAQCHRRIEGRSTLIGYHTGCTCPTRGHTIVITDEECAPKK